MMLSFQYTAGMDEEELESLISRVSNSLDLFVNLCLVSKIVQLESRENGKMSH